MHLLIKLVIDLLMFYSALSALTSIKYLDKAYLLIVEKFYNYKEKNILHTGKKLIICSMKTK